MYSVHDLAALIAVADAGSVRGAADLLGRTQPAVTQAIRRLELAVNFPLLDRSAYRARLTDRGKSFVERARPSVKQMAALRDLAGQLARGVEPRIRIAIDGAIPATAWTSLVAGVSAAFPDTVIEIEAGEAAAPLRRLTNGTADLAVLFDLVVHRSGSSLECQRLGAAEFVTALRGDRREQLDDPDSAFPQILVADFEQPAPEYGRIEGRRCWRVQSHQMQADAICAGLGWGSTPALLIGRGLEDGSLHTVQHMGLSKRSAHSFSLYRKRDRLAGPAAKAIWDNASAKTAD